MRNRIFRLGLMLVLGIAFLSGVVLYATPTQDEPARPDLERANRDGRFQPCPVPPCMAPCSYPPQPEVLCRDTDGSVSVTSFTCCCCGGSAGVSFRPI